MLEMFTVTIAHLELCGIELPREKSANDGYDIFCSFQIYSKISP